MPNGKKKKKKDRKRWQFCWCDEDSPPKNGDAHDWKSRIYVADSFEEAMDKMLSFINSRPYNCLVDYECAALHVKYDPKKHDEHFLRIDRSGHGLAEYAD